MRLRLPCHLPADRRDPTPPLPILVELVAGQGRSIRSAAVQGAGGTSLSRSLRGSADLSEPAPRDEGPAVFLRLAEWLHRPCATLANDEIGGNALLVSGLIDSVAPYQLRCCLSGE